MHDDFQCDQVCTVPDCPSFHRRRRVRSLLHIVNGLTRQRDALLDTEAQFRGVVEQNIAGVYILTERGDVAYLHERFAQLCGCTAAEVCGRPFLDFVAPADRFRAKASFAASMHGDSQQLEFTLLGKDGRTPDVIAHGASSPPLWRRGIRTPQATSDASRSSRPQSHRRWGATRRRSGACTSVP